MPKNFDEEYAWDRTFVIAGETFTGQIAAAEDLARWDMETNGKDPSWAESRAKVEERVKIFLTPTDQERFDEILQRKPAVVSDAQLNGLSEFLLETNTSRPTNPPSPSGAGRGKTAA